MKRVFFYLAAGALALTACTSDEVLDESRVQSNAIGFENVVSKQTRANVTDLTLLNLSKFIVYGYYTMPNYEAAPIQVFDGVEVTRSLTTNPNPWGYNTPRYWVPGGNYYFYAYSCNNSGLDENYGSFAMDMSGDTPNDRTLKINQYKCDNNHQHDLIYAAKEGVTGKGNGQDVDDAYKGSNDAVSLKFKHLLSKVNATFTSEFPANYSVIISNVRIENIRNIGWYNPNSGWYKVEREENVTEDPKVYLLSTGDGTIEATAQDPAITNSAFVLPYTYNSGDVRIKFNIALMNGDEELLHRHLSGSWSPDWKMGYSYTYNVKISGSTANLEVIAFVTESDDEGQAVEDWNTGSSPTINISAN